MSSKSGSTSSPLPSSPLPNSRNSPLADKKSSPERGGKMKDEGDEERPAKEEEVEEIEEVKPKRKSTFSIQSILARPEPRRPVIERTFPYPHMFQPNLSAFFPQKLVPGHSFFPMWPGHLMNHSEYPENLSTKPTFGVITSRTSPLKPETFSNDSLKLPSKPTAEVPRISPAEPSRGSKSPSLISDDRDDGLDDRDCKSPASLTGSASQRRKKTRTVFSRSQVFQLESMFDNKRYLSSAERAALAASLNLSEQQIKIWFQNRRNKWKRQLCSDLDTSSLTASQLQAAAGRFASSSAQHGSTLGPNFPMSLYSFPPGMMGSNEPGSNIFCPSSLHPLYMTGHLPFSRS
ncbi:hypothetical protein RvY_17810 [Ramazzottius varieornatus]|uniref:Homeobox domain-containing protein n=1 Tax=Ramazzottius varieornatus TaxID=947166 RepID=A0A1D1W3I4_RAMVA|nr:hypothetical protein RvY_17810 [Ramazzottius varieornatus]